MGRGRTPSVSDTRLLLEILLCRDRAVFGAEIADHVGLSNERVRQRMSELDERDLVETNQVSNRNLYRLTDAGLNDLSEALREIVD